jgi:uncharacterized protein (TIGR02270 family)
MTRSRPVIESIVEQHADEAAFLWRHRSVFLNAPHITLHQLFAHDERIDAHLDGLRIAGERGWQACASRLAAEDPGAMFSCMLLAIESGDSSRVDRLLTLAEAVPALQGALTSAFGWASAGFLKGRVVELLDSPSPFRRRVGIASGAMHRIDVGKPLDKSMEDQDRDLRARALRAAGELGRRERLDACLRAINDPDLPCAFWAAWSALLLGNRREALAGLMRFGTSNEWFASKALHLALQAMDVQHAREMLMAISRAGVKPRVVIAGAGVVGDPAYIPSFIKQMRDAGTSRVAADAFCRITGADLVDLNLTAQRPGPIAGVPESDADDDLMEGDPDEDVPWPAWEKIQRWWTRNEERFPQGDRYFGGQRVSAKHCKRVLGERVQRQRTAAALYLSLLAPGTVLFPTSAPARRQRRWLQQMK